MSDPFATLPGLLDQVWHHLNQGAHHASAPARLLVLASVDATGGPRARTLALRAADRAKTTLTLHTDAATPKVTELRANPRAALHVWIPETQLQIRLRGLARITTGSDADWQNVPDISRANYGVMPAPGTPIPHSDAYTRHPDLAKFAVLDILLDDIDVVHLCEPLHHRAAYTRASGWAGQWLAP